MSTKYFHFDGGVSKVIRGQRYREGAQVEVQMREQPQLAIQGWHSIDATERAAITKGLLAAGWIEGGQSKPDGDEAEHVIE